jgi:branched-chain amino acid transport system substrate-binding protein
VIDALTKAPYAFTRNPLERFTRIAGAFLGILVMTAVMGAGSASGASTDKSGTSGTPIVIGAVVAETGPAGTFGTGVVNGMQTEVNIINASGGVLGRKLKLKAIDDGTDAATASQGIQQLLSTQPYPAFVDCGVITTDCEAILPTTTRAKVTTIGDATTPALEDASQNPYNFVTLPDSTLQVEGEVAALRKVGGKSVGMMTTNDEGAVVIVNTLAAALPKDGLAVKGTESVSETATDLTPELESLRQKGVTSIFAQFTNPSLYVTMMDNIESMGWTKVQVVAGLAAAVQSVMTAIPSGGLNRFHVLATRALLRTGPTIKSMPVPEQKFLKQLAKIQPDPALLSALVGADEVSIAAWAAKQAHSANTSAIFKVLSHLNTSKQSPANVLLQMPNPKWSTTVRGFQNANLSQYYAILSPGQPIDGTYAGLPITVK